MGQRDDLAVVYDNTDRLSIWWRVGSIVNRTAHDVPAVSWRDAYERIRVLNDRSTIRELHVWGHGRAGAPLIAGRPVDLVKLFEVVPSCWLVWWRSCDVHKGQTGKAFARRAAELFGASVGHTQVISAPLPWQQRGICGLRRGEDPWWSDAGGELRSVSALRMTVPDFAWRR